MNTTNQRKRIKEFIAHWTGRGYEKGDTQPFWTELLELLGVEQPSVFIKYEYQVHRTDGGTSFVDGYIPSTHIIIEQKSIDKDLDAPIKQSDGVSLTPFQQTKRYSAELIYDERPRWIVTCNFREFRIYDMNQSNSEPTKIQLKDLEKDLYLLQFLTHEKDASLQKEMEISLQAGELVGRLYDALLEQYNDPTSPQTLHSLNVLCVRLVFCLYAEDAGLFSSHTAFHDYLASFNPDNVRKALIDLFKTLDTKSEERDPYERPDLLAFPYVNGGLFADERIETPRLTTEILHLILKDCSADFDWSGISPTIFGAVFESTLNPETRRSGGMHYTSIENIHKVIDPLFLSSLTDELKKIEAIAQTNRRNKALEAFQLKLSKLRFLDPACGSGNFLTETYISLRRLENRCIKLRYGDGQMVLGDEMSPIMVGISQFYGIEINDFAATVAKTALWIAECQMMKETEDIVGKDLDFLPLKTYTNITVGNALQIDWEEVTPRERLSYIMGNPPFVGYAYQTKEQKNDIKVVTPLFGSNVDYVACWYYKAAQMMQDTTIRAAFVSTNSISQGEQVTNIWKVLFYNFKIHFDFAYRTFRWDSETSLKAHVHCVIIGFSHAPCSKPKFIIENEAKKEVGNINGYLIDADNIFIERRATPLCDVPAIYRGSQPTDGGFLILTEEEKDNLLAQEPQAARLIRPFMMGKDFIERKPRYCLWLVDADPSVIRKCPNVYKRILNVRDFRLASKKVATRKKAETPTLFDEVHECATSYVAIPKVSSERRRYIPMDFLSKDIIPGDKLFMMPNATLYHFGVLMSNVHMAWMRAVCGRLEMRYSYSNTIVYNNFPWPQPTEEQRMKIEQTAQGILDARAQRPNASLADLYDEIAMPPELRKAHQQNDRAVMKAYGFPIKGFTESDCVAALMDMYKALVDG